MAERAGCLSAAGLVVILTVALTIYGAAAFQGDAGAIGVKTLSGRELQRDPLQVSRFTHRLLQLMSRVAIAQPCP